MSITEEMYAAKPPTRYECPQCHFLVQEREREMHEIEHGSVAVTRHASNRDLALTAVLQVGKFVHLTFADRRVEQGWVHLHDGHLECCATERREDCDVHREKAARMRGFSRGQGAESPIYRPLDVEQLIRIDVSIIGGGEYTSFWHHPVFSGQHHTLSRERLACCPTGGS